MREGGGEGGLAGYSSRDESLPNHLDRPTATARPYGRTVEERTNEWRPQEVNNVPLTLIHTVPCVSQGPAAAPDGEGGREGYLELWRQLNAGRD